MKKILLIIPMMFVSQVFADGFDDINSNAFYFGLGFGFGSSPDVKINFANGKSETYSTGSPEYYYPFYIGYDVALAPRHHVLGEIVFSGLDNYENPQSFIYSTSFNAKYNYYITESVNIGILAGLGGTSAYFNNVMPYSDDTIGLYTFHYDIGVTAEYVYNGRHGFGIQAVAYYPQSSSNSTSSISNNFGIVDNVVNISDIEIKNYYVYALTYRYIVR